MFILPQRATVAHLEVQAISNPLTEGQGGHLTYLLALKIPHAGRGLKKMPLVPKPTLAGCALWLLPVHWWIAPQITVIHSAIPGFESSLLLGWDPENPTRPLGVWLIWGHAHSEQPCSKWYFHGEHLWSSQGSHLDPFPSQLLLRFSGFSSSLISPTCLTCFQKRNLRNSFVPR